MLNLSEMYELFKKGYHLYVVCVSSTWIRDAQYYHKSYDGEVNNYDPKSDENNYCKEINESSEKDDEWEDYSPNDFIGTVIATDENDAIRKVAEKYNYNPRHLVAYNAFDTMDFRY